MNPLDIIRSLTTPQTDAELERQLLIELGSLGVGNASLEILLSEDDLTRPSSPPPHPAP